MKKTVLVLTLFFLFFACFAKEPYTNINAYIAAVNQTTDAIKARKWDEAIIWLDRQFDYSHLIDVNKARNYIELGMLFWNINKKDMAYRCICEAVSIMRNGDNLGSRCETRTVLFLKKMKEGRLPKTFNPSDFISPCGLRDFLMEVPDAVFNRKTDEIIARYDALGKMFDAQAGIYTTNMRYQEKTAKIYARTEYRKSTGREFDPYRRPSYGKVREEWEACKRVYDIFN